VSGIPRHSAGGHSWLPQCLDQRSAPPARAVAHDRSPIDGDVHQAAVLDPPAEPSERQVMVADFTMIWPSGSLPRGPPSKRTSRSRASIAPIAGHGWPGRHDPSNSRAATPAIRIFGPSTHQIGPSPSQTATGVHRKVWPFGMTSALTLPCEIAGAARTIAATNPNRLTRTLLRLHRDQGVRHSLDRRDEQGQRRQRVRESNSQSFQRYPMTPPVKRANARMKGCGGSDSRQSSGCCDSPRH
jgi:hypothetical protein